MSLSWEEPPAPPRAELTLQEQLRERPGTWAKVLVADKVAVSRLGGELHREGFEIRPTDEPDADGSYALYAQWNPDGPTIAVVRPGAGDPAATTEQLRDEALAHLLAETVEAAHGAQGPDLEHLLARARRQVKALFSGPDEVRRYLQSLGASPV